MNEIENFPITNMWNTVFALKYYGRFRIAAIFCPLLFVSFCFILHLSFFLRLFHQFFRRGKKFSVPVGDSYYYYYHPMFASISLVSNHQRLGFFSSAEFFIYCWEVRWEGLLKSVFLAGGGEGLKEYFLEAPKNLGTSS